MKAVRSACRRQHGMVEDIGNGALVERGATIGRYLVLNLLGKGGMGEVYAAYDPELDRKVAIKVLHPRSSTGAGAAEGRARMLREAQALAQLSDPNVVGVYDVGTFGERVFLAMEFVDGSTLSFWQHSETRSWREIVERYAEAGRGLAAAHKRGLVHRDFKPDNAMVGRDGHVRVMDFGLARSEAQPEPAPPAVTPSGPIGPAAGAATEASRPTSSPSSRPSSIEVTNLSFDDPAAAIQTRDLRKPTDLERSPGQSPPALASSLTQSGAMLGTPMYMAPEQLEGKVADAKSDQFAFCVSLYEALYGERPFSGKDLFDLTRQVMAGRVREAPPGSRTPGWVRKVILRGLRVDRDERHPTMEALLQALARDPSRRRRRYAAATALAGLIAALAGGLIQMSQSQKMKCLGADRKLAGVWELPERAGAPLSARKQAIRSAFMKTGKGYAGEAFALVQSGLDRYVAAWNDMHRDACEANHLRGEQSAEVLDLRMICLQDRFNELRSLTSVFNDANGDVVTKSAEAVQSLRPVQQCGDIATLKAVVRPPDDPDVRRAVAEVRVALADVKALGGAGKVKQAAARIGAIVATSRLTKYEPLMAEASLETAELAVQAGDFAASESKYEDAIWLAESSRHDEAALQASAQLVFTVGYVLGRFRDGERWSNYAAALLRRLGPGHDQLKGWLANNRAMFYEKQGRYQDALEAGQQAVKSKVLALGENHFDVAVSYSNVASVLMDLGRIDEGVDMNERAIEIFRATLGPQHPSTASAVCVHAELMYARRDFAKAVTLSETTLGIWEREWGADNLALAYPLTTLGQAFLGLDQAKQAIPLLERALRIRQVSDPQPDLLAKTRFELARALFRTGSQTKGRRLAEQALKELRGVAQAAPPVAKLTADVEKWLSSSDATPARLSMQ